MGISIENCLLVFLLRFKLVFTSLEHLFAVKIEPQSVDFFKNFYIIYPITWDGQTDSQKDSKECSLDS